ncbi:MAG: hypothetical protein EOO63_07620 [Hymenobacter sp.]|nr:MAG: hypothetical protein EOO63_07620 [Hymenobacter sp.]
MVIYLQEYKDLLQKGIIVLDNLLEIYTPDKQAENDWATICLSDTRNLHRSLSERLANPRLTVTPEETSPVMVAIQQYIENHWADYREFPVANAQKRALLVDLHAQLKIVAKGVGQLYNAVMVSK